MASAPWSDRPKIDDIALTDVFMRRVPTSGTKNQEIPFSDITTFMNGSSRVYVESESDLPALLGGFHQLEFDKDYVFTEPSTITDPILFPAAWIGTISKSFFTTQTITYTGTTPMFQTLNIDGEITLITDGGGGTIKVGTSAPHGLIDGQFVNITGTTSYNQNALVVSAASGSAFDVELAFVGSETGQFNTGFRTIRFDKFDAINPGTADFMDITSAGIFETVLSFETFACFGFNSPGTIRNGSNVITDAAFFGFATKGLTLENCLATSFTVTNFLSTDPLALTAIAVTITGANTDRLSIINSKFTMSAATQIPVRIDGTTITNSSGLTFATSPDNGITTDYFDTSSGGLDETDPQVIAQNNGARKNSQTIAESRSNLTLEIDGSGGIDVPIIDITPVAGDWIEDSATERFSVDTTTGLITYNGLNPVTAMISYSLSAAQTSGGAQTILFDLHINGIEQIKSEIIIVTAGVGSPVSSAYNGGNFLISPGDTFQLFKDNTTNTNNTDVTLATLLINIV